MGSVNVLNMSRLLCDPSEALSGYMYQPWGKEFGSRQGEELGSRATETEARKSKPLAEGPFISGESLAFGQGARCPVLVFADIDRSPMGLHALKERGGAREGFPCR